MGVHRRIFIPFGPFSDMLDASFGCGLIFTKPHKSIIVNIRINTFSQKLSVFLDTLNIHVFIYLKYI